jgi:proton-dependent oligopeptide transporter, POT family
MDSHKSAILGHPTGLAVLSVAELGNRISYYGMQSLLVLYMVEQQLLPGHIDNIAGFAVFRAVVESVTGPLSAQALASQIFGLYMGLATLTPFFGGMIGDKVLGRHVSIVLGGILRVTGQLCMMSETLFLVGLLLLIMGIGLMESNLTSRVGALYPHNDPRRSSGFQIFYWTFNIAALIAPLATGTLMRAYGWRYGFGFLALGLVFGLTVYLAGYRHLPMDEISIQHAEKRKTRLTPRERRTVIVLVLLAPIFSLFWLAASQTWNVYNLWLRDHVNLRVGGWTVPVPAMQALDGVATIVLVPLVLVYWRWQSARGVEPHDFSKIAIGCILFGISLVWLACSQFIAPSSGKVPLAWTFGYYAISNIAYLYFAPVAIATFSRSPKSVNAMMIGVYYLAVFAGSTISGRLGGLYEHLTTPEFWLLHAAIVFAAGLVILCLAPQLRKILLSSNE